MALTDADKRWLEEAIKNNCCACGLSAEERHEMPHHLGMIRDMGKGDLRQGIENTRDAIKFRIYFNSECTVTKLGGFNEWA